MLSFDATRQIPVMEHFYTLQGEGVYSGQAAYFIRLAGCDVGCHWCDVKDSWTVSAEQLMDIDTLVGMAAGHPSRLAVITGGEPLMYDLGPLTAALHQKGFRVHLETSGAYPLSGNFDWICLSPKKFKPPLEEILPLAHELKIIIFNTSDFSWAKQYASKVSPGCRLLVQPEWDKLQKLMPAVIRFVKDHPQWQLSLQTHKYLDIP